MCMSVLCCLGLCSHVFTEFRTDVPLAVYCIYYLHSAHFQTLKEDTQFFVFFSNSRHYIYKPGLVHVCLFSTESLTKQSELFATE